MSARAPESTAVGTKLPQRSLQRSLLLAFLPLGCGVAAAVAVVLVQMSSMHRDVQRMFEENREVALARSLQEELRGILQWVEAIRLAKPDARPLIVDDQRQHLGSAQATLARFGTADDPSRLAHRDREAAMTRDLDGALARIERLLAAEPTPALRAEIEAAMQLATTFANEIVHEDRSIGDDLDRRSATMLRLVLLLGIGIAGTLTALAWLFVRQVLRPLAELRAGAIALADGTLAVRLPVRADDELGLLASTLNTMASRLQASQQDLEQRVAQRSREVLRTARLADLGTLAAGIAHEINNPLAAIVACAEGLLRDRPQTDASARTREYLEIVRKESLRARDITTRLLSFAHQQPGSRGSVRLDRELTEVAAMLAHQAQQRGVRLDLETSGPQRPILGDSGELRQVLFNLLKNALDASPDGGVIRCRCTTVDGRVELTVDDQGAGVPGPLREQIFEPFFTTKAPGQGTGLGLAIAHRIVTAHGGSLAVGDAPGGGARFRVELAAAPK